jgi:porin
VEAGLAYNGLIPGRENDSVGVSVDYARISSRASRLNQDTRFFTGNPLFPIRNYEMALELTYQAQVTPWLLAQPDVQYINNPGGRVLNADGSVRPNALVFGLRTAITF